MGLGQHDDHAVPTKCLLSVGLGLLFSACLSVVGRAGDAFWSSEMSTAAFFFLGMCSGAFLTCVVGFVAVLVVSHKNLSQKLGRLCMTLVLLVGLVCSELGSCLHVMFDNMYLIVGWYRYARLTCWNWVLRHGFMLGHTLCESNFYRGAKIWHTCTGAWCCWLSCCRPADFQSFLASGYCRLFLSECQLLHHSYSKCSSRFSIFRVCWKC